MARDRVEVIGTAVEPYREDTSMSAEEMGFLLARQAREAAVSSGYLIRLRQSKRMLSHEIKDHFPAHGSQVKQLGHTP